MAIRSWPVGHPCRNGEGQWEIYIHPDRLHLPGAVYVHRITCKSVQHFQPNNPLNKPSHGVSTRVVNIFRRFKYSPKTHLRLSGMYYGANQNKVFGVNAAVGEEPTNIFGCVFGRNVRYSSTNLSKLNPFWPEGKSDNE